MTGTSHRGHRHLARGAQRREADARALTAALVIVLSIMGVEIAAGILSGSLALLADAGHMLTDALALGFALVAIRVAARPAGGVWTYGLGRMEVLAAQTNGISLLIVGLWITYEAVRRLIEPPQVQGGVVLVVAIVGALGNLAAASLLAHASRESINVRGAFLHVATDLAAFAGTAAAGAAILLTGWHRFDPIASLGVAVLCFAAALSLIRESLRIMLEGSPGHIDPETVGRTLAAHPEVVEIHDLHIWTVTSGFPALSAHVLVRRESDCHGVRAQLATELVERFGLEHTTLQVDHISPGKASWR